MNVKISKWGNSLAIRIPSSVARSVRLTEGEALEIKEEGDRIVLEPHKRRIYDLEELLSGVTAENLHKEVAVERAGKEW